MKILDLLEMDNGFDDDYQIAHCSRPGCEYTDNIAYGEDPSEYSCPTHRAPLVSEEENDDIEFEHDQQLVTQAGDNEEDLYNSQGF